MNNSYFYIDTNTKGQFYWRLRDRNSEIIAVSGESYVTKYGCQRAIDNVKREVPRAGVIDLTKKAVG